MQVYLDANIYLDYFKEHSADGLAPLNELVKLIEKGKVTLLVPDQTKQEYFRNRKRLAEVSRQALQKQSAAKFVPPPASLNKNTREVKKVVRLTKELKNAYKKLAQKYEKAVGKEETEADKLAKKLLGKLGVRIEEDKEIIERAYVRYMKGNPPRKNDHSYGDAITWESILEKADRKDSLVIISRDGDFIEYENKKPVLNSFLQMEWKERSRRKITLYRSLGDFINTFSKKQVVKKKVVDKENSSPDYDNVAYAHIPLATASDSINSTYGELIGVPDHLVANTEVIHPLVESSAFNTIDSSAFLSADDLLLSRSLNKVSFCPYCGGKAKNDPYSFGFKCTSCNKTFSGR